MRRINLNEASARNVSTHLQNGESAGRSLKRRDRGAKRVIAGLGQNEGSHCHRNLPLGWAQIITIILDDLVSNLKICWQFQKTARELQVSNTWQVGVLNMIGIELCVRT